MPPMPVGKATVFGGTIHSIDQVRDPVEISGSSDPGAHGTGFDTILERDLPPGYCIEEPRLSFRSRARHIRSIGSKKQGPDPITK